jgi:hypothetical protein
LLQIDIFYVNCCRLFVFQERYLIFWISFFVFVPHAPDLIANRKFEIIFRYFIEFVLNSGLEYLGSDFILHILTLLTFCIRIIFECLQFSKCELFLDIIRISGILILFSSLKFQDFVFCGAKICISYFSFDQEDTSYLILELLLFDSFGTEWEDDCVWRFS